MMTFIFLVALALVLYLVGWFLNPARAQRGGWKISSGDARNAIPPVGATSTSGTPGVLLIEAERDRQLALGFDRNHDVTHPPGLFAREAACYARYAADVLDGLVPPDMGAPNDWPEGGCEWKPRNALRALAKAGALCAAELDRNIHVLGDRG